MRELNFPYVQLFLAAKEGRYLQITMPPSESFSMRFTAHESGGAIVAESVGFSNIISSLISLEGVMSSRVDEGLSASRLLEDSVLDLTEWSIHLAHHLLDLAKAKREDLRRQEEEV